MNWATTTFVVLFIMHLLDYIDRWTISGVLSKLQPDLGLSDTQAGSLNIYFLVMYSLVSPIMGFAGDRFRRTWLLAAGVGLWSLATVGTGLVRDFDELRIARTILGIGEATYGVIAPTILMDLFSRHTRARVMAGFYLAMPIGYALGVISGGLIAEHSQEWFAGTFLEPYSGWRMAFFVVGAPGLLAAFSVLFLPEPVRGASEDVDIDRAKANERVRPKLGDYQDLAVTSSYAYVVLGMASYTFAFGGLAFWLPTYLERVKGFGHDQAVLIVGLTGLFAAVTGMTGGGWLADRLSKTYPRALFLVPGVSMISAVPFVLLGLFAQSTPMIILFLFLAETLMLANTGPCNAIIANVVVPNLRATAYAVAIFTLHFLGDVWSPWLMGLVSDYFGQADTMATGLGQFLASWGVVPVEEGGNLAAGMLVVVPAIFLGGLVMLAGSRHLPREMALMVAKFRAGPLPKSKPDSP